jgi:hypothetical protein
MFLDSRIALLCDKFDKVVEELSSCPSFKILEILESLAGDLRIVIAKTEVECYDTLNEVDSLCYEAEMRNNINYSVEIEKIKGLYREEAGL